MRQAAVADLGNLLVSETDLLWVDITEPDESDARVMLDVFNFHPLAVEDTRNYEQRPKIEQYPGYLFLIVNAVSILRHPSPPPQQPVGAQFHDVDFHELDIFVGRNYMVTVHLAGEPVIPELKRRLEMGASLSMSISYLLYAALDAVVDGYFPVMDMLEEEISQLEDRILLEPKQATLNRLFELKRMLLHLWRVIWPERDILSVLTHPHNLVFGDPNAAQFYLRDVSDHLLWVADMIGMYRDTLTTMIDLYMSSVSNRLNRVVNRLTVLTLTIGVMTVVSGFYGMNFLQTWPPFDNPMGVPFVLALMLVGIGAVLFFVWRMNRE